MVTVDSGKEFSGEAGDAFDDADDISAVPDTLTPACNSPCRQGRFIHAALGGA
jgi:hypothetical protein